MLPEGEAGLNCNRFSGNVKILWICICQWEDEETPSVWQCTGKCRVVIISVAIRYQSTVKKNELLCLSAFLGNQILFKNVISINSNPNHSHVTVPDPSRFKRVKISTLQEQSKLFRLV